MPPPLVLNSISAVSPSLAEVLRMCLLQAGLSRAEGTGQFVLGNPKAWLGVAYHAVLQQAGHRVDANPEGAHETAWATAINDQRERACNHPLDRRFGPPERWPGYHLVHAMAILRAREVATTSHGTPTLGAPQWEETSREQWFSCANGRLVGRPDLFRDDAIIDYKTGDVYEYSDHKAAKASYIRQLQTYAFLVKECTGKWPTRAMLLPMEGPPMEIELDPATCEGVAANALELLERYNYQIRAGGAAVRLARPSPEACRWCAYQMLCPAFWKAAGDLWTELISPAAVGGPALRLPRPIYGGGAVALSLWADEGTGLLGDVSLAPLSPEVHTSLAQVQVGMRVRATGLARRADGTVVPTLRSVIAGADDLPAIVLRDAVE